MNFSVQELQFMLAAVDSKLCTSLQENALKSNAQGKLVGAIFEANQPREEKEEEEEEVVKKRSKPKTVKK